MPTQETHARPADSWRSYGHGDLPLTPILQAALDTFQEKGYHGTTVRDIATRAGLTMPALYYHHGNKEGILMALLDIAMNDVLARTEAALADAGDDTRQQFVNLTIVVALHTTHRRDLASLHSEYRFLGPEARAAYVAKRDRLYYRLIDLLEQGADEGVFDQPDGHHTARALLGMLLAITDWYHDDGPATPEQVAESYVAIALKIAGARPVTGRPSVRRRRT